MCMCLLRRKDPGLSSTHHRPITPIKGGGEEIFFFLIIFLDKKHTIHRIRIREFFKRQRDKKRKTMFHFFFRKKNLSSKEPSLKHKNPQGRFDMAYHIALVHPTLCCDATCNATHRVEREGSIGNAPIGESPSNFPKSFNQLLAISEFIDPIANVNQI